MEGLETFAGRSLRIKERKIYNDSRVDDEIEGKRKFDVEEKLHDEKFNQNLSDFILELSGKDFDLKYIQEHGFNTPILFKKKDGLGLRMPDAELFTVNDVKSYVGARRMIDVFDCDTHQADQMSVHHWVRYYTGSEREKILNVTSLEFSHTGLDRIVECPTTVTKDLDWVQLAWPKHLLAEQKDTTNTIENMKYPKVRKYVLMSVAGCYTDFHIDFGGTSVWYHVLKGAKVFWLIPPSEKNLDIYERWVLSSRQQDVFLGDLVDNCYRIHLVAGDTFMIPTGWIHSVYTPDDSLVFGGNYLHSFNIAMQLKAYDIEENTHVPKRLRYPFFSEIHWYIIKSYVDILEKDLDERRMLEFEEDNDEGAFKLVKDEIDSESEKVHAKWQCVYLTVYELEGLKLLCERFRSWTHAKTNYPNDLTEDGMELLDRLEEVLQYHEDDDQILACRGINFFQQMELRKESKVPPTSPLNTPLEKPPKETPTPPNISIKKEVIDEDEETKRKISFEHDQEKSTGVKTKPRVSKHVKRKKTIIRRVRCQTCEGCIQENCDVCRFCLDMPKNGGMGRLRKPCTMRFCKNPRLPSYVVCTVCDESKTGRDEVLMECNICGEIVHPMCLTKRAPCKISKKVNNSWECPKCCEDEQGPEFSFNLLGGVISENKRKWLEKVGKPDIAPEKKRVNKVENLKSLIKNVKFLDKVKIKDALKASNEKENEKRIKEKVQHSDDSDDEPLIKKKKTKVDTTTVITNGHTPLEEVKPIAVIRPGPIDSPYLCLHSNNDQHVLQGSIWGQVYTYLNKKDILCCMLVCKAWNQWCIDSKLWRKINVSNKMITQSMLKGIVRRQPRDLNMSSTSINGKQLEWLLKRLPSLQRLDLSLSTAFAVSAIMRVTCPPLTSLKLSWCDAIYDRFITQIFAPIKTTTNDVVPISRLHFLEHLDLTGCDISDETVHYVFTTLTSLRTLDVSHCVRVSASCLDILLKHDAVCKDTLQKFVCVGCPLVTEQCVKKFQDEITAPKIIMT